MNFTRILANCRATAINQWAEGHPRSVAMPWLCYISVTNLCNNRCVVCAREKTMRREQGLMSFETFTRIVDELPPDIRKVYMFKQGEPLIHPQLERFVEYLRGKRPEVFISIHTNGILAGSERMKRLLGVIDSLGVSISATDEATYRRVHGSDGFAAVTANLAGINDILRGMPREKRPHVFIDYVQQRANAHLAEEEVVAFFRSRYPALGSVDFHWVFNYQGAIEEGNKEVYERLSPHDFPTCVFPWSSVTFLHDGKVSYCFVEPRENVFLGDIATQSFEEIWNGPAWADFRRRMTAGEYDSLLESGFGCRRCSWLWSMKSQSPRSLSVGYTLPDRLKGAEWDVGDMLDHPIDDIFERAVAYYRQGEVHRAVGYFTVLARVTTGDTRQAAEEMLSLCCAVIDKYQLLSTWKQTLAEEGLAFEDMQCRYYRIANEEAEQA